MITIADYLKEPPGHPVYVQGPGGPMRVVGVIGYNRVRGGLPFAMCITDQGQRVDLGVLYSTELFSCPDCQDTGEVDSTDIPGMSAQCPECQVDEPYLPPQYP